MVGGNGALVEDDEKLSKPTREVRERGHIKTWAVPVFPAGAERPIAWSIR